MTAFRKSFLIFAALFAAMMPGGAAARVVVGFYSHDFGSSFPHAFVTVKGTLDRGGPAIDTNYGFTAKSVTPTILMGSVAGVLESVDAKYVEKSDRQFQVTLSDDQYDALITLVAKWRALPGKSYSLNKRNCVHFVGQAAQTAGLKVVFDQKLMKKPKSFLLAVIALNPSLKGS